jgi:hypothetical protein
MDESEIQEQADNPREIGAEGKKNRLLQALNIVGVLLVLWLARDWLRESHWLNGSFQKKIARMLGISSGAIGTAYFLAHSAWQIFHANSKKKQKRAEEEKKQFNPRYNPIAERDSESWSHERHHD